MGVELGFYPTVKDAYEFQAVSKPFVELMINSRDTIQVIDEDLVTGWSVDVTPNVISYDYSNFRGLTSSNSNSTAHYTKTINLPFNGYYLIILRLRKHPKDTGNVSLYIDDKLLWKTITTTDKSEHTESVQFPITIFKAGDHDFDIKINKQAYISDLVIYPITRYIYSNQKGSINKYCKEIDCTHIGFTENGANENNILTAEIPMHDGLFNQDNKSNIFSDFKDHVTLQLGHDYKNAVYKFGGYTLNPNLSGNKLIFKAMDRFLDYVLQPVDRKFAIGTPPDKDYVSYGSVWELGRYFSSIIEYPIVIDDEYFSLGLSVDYADLTSYNNVTLSNLQKSQDSTKEDSLFLYSGTTPNTIGTYILWSSTTPVNVTNNKLFFLRYNTYNKTPLPINITVWMYRDNETAGDAQPYELIFLGPDNENITDLGTVSSQTDNTGWSGATFNLYNAFKTLNPNSTNFYVTKVSGECTVSSAMASNPSNYGIWIKSLQFYPVSSAAPKLSFEDAKTAYAGMQKTCEDSGHVAFIVPAMDRCDDRIVLIPANYSESAEKLGETTNIIEVSDWSFDPLQDGLCNYRTAYYTTSSTSTKNYVNSRDRNSILRNGYVKSQIEELNGIVSAADAQVSVDNYISENKIKEIGVGFKINGSVLYDTSQYVLAEVDSKRLTSNYRIMSIEHDINLDTEAYISAVDVNRLPAWIRARKIQRQYRDLYNAKHVKIF